MGDSKHTSYKQQNDPDQQQRPEESSGSPDNCCPVDEQQREETLQGSNVIGSVSSSSSIPAASVIATTTTRAENSVNLTFPSLSLNFNEHKNTNQSNLLNNNDTGESIESTSGQNTASNSSYATTVNLEPLFVSSISLDRKSSSNSSNFTGSISRPKRPSQDPLANVTAALHQFLEQKAFSASGSSASTLAGQSHSSKLQHTAQFITTKTESTYLNSQSGTVTCSSKELKSDTNEDEIALQPLSNQASNSIHIN